MLEVGGKIICNDSRTKGFIKYLNCIRLRICCFVWFCWFLSHSFYKMKKFVVSWLSGHVPSITIRTYGTKVILAILSPSLSFQQDELYAPNSKDAGSPNVKDTPTPFVTAVDVDESISNESALDVRNLRRRVLVVWRRIEWSACVHNSSETFRQSDVSREVWDSLN